MGSDGHYAWQVGVGKRLARCHERQTAIVDTFFDSADAIIAIRTLIRRAWITHRWTKRPERRR
ncbi:hypothetical protein AB0L65_33410 [Nonomuraea sp. NPDC052116]|uniref:hypothetical protein n=1 Tax=Nonomuraea sp. NPDC052116 TaxID=3155665 RepID=UPI0034311915